MTAASSAAQSIAFQTGAIAGPALGGVIVGVNVPLAYAVSLSMFLLAVAAFILIRTSGKPAPQANPLSPVESVKEGLAYVWKTKIVLGAISLDLVVVLLAVFFLFDWLIGEARTSRSKAKNQA